MGENPFSIHSSNPLKCLQCILPVKKHFVFINTGYFDGIASMMTESFKKPKRISSLLRSIAVA